MKRGATREFLKIEWFWIASPLIRGFRGFFHNKIIIPAISSHVIRCIGFSGKIFLICLYIGRIANLPELDIFRGSVICWINRNENIRVFTAQKQFDSETVPTERWDIIGSVQAGFGIEIQNESAIFNIH